MVDNYNVGKVWADKNVPLYLEQAQPYITVILASDWLIVTNAVF